MLCSGTPPKSLVVPSDVPWCWFGMLCSGTPPKSLLVPTSGYFGSLPNASFTRDVDAQVAHRQAGISPVRSTLGTSPGMLPPGRVAAEQDPFVFFSFAPSSSDLLPRRFLLLLHFSFVARHLPPPPEFSRTKFPHHVDASSFFFYVRVLVHQFANHFHTLNVL